MTDAKGTRTYRYDGTDAHGKTERRGLVTSLTVTRPGTGGSLAWTAGYDADGNLTRQGLPGRISQLTRYDEGGEPVEMSYLGQVTPVTESTDPDTGETTWTPGTPVQDRPWMTWSTGNDSTGRARLQATGTGAAFDDGTGVATIEDVADWTAAAAGQAASYAREYRYDPAGRLTYARSAETTPDPDTGSLVSTCIERAYTFDANGRRTALATTNHADGDCSAAGTTTTTSSTGWDTADRPTTGRDNGQGGTGSYVYDLFGRQTTLPAVDAPDPAKGDITLAYFDDDLARAITQGDTSTTFTLDAAGRRSTQTTTSPAGTTTTVRRYTDDGDNPGWTETTAPGAQTAVVTRFAGSIGGDLSATIAADGGTTLSLADPHGDIVTTVPIDAGQASSTPAVAIGGWASYDEYGNPASPATTDQVDGPIGYGWLGAKQRSTTTETAGLTLMGVRLYNPATGLFTSIDPVPGGNSTAYAYPNDPINMLDLDGRWGWFKKAVGWAWKNRGTIAAVSTLFCTVCATAMAVYAGYKAIQSVRRGDWRGAAWSAAGAFGGGRALRGLTAAGQRGARFSGKIYRNRTAAERAAHRYANKRPHTRKFRGTHGRNPDHVHVDTSYRGRVVHTRHYYW